MKIHQDVSLFRSELGAGARVEHALQPGRAAWVQVARGQVRVNGQLLSVGDGAALEDEPKVALEGVQDADVLLFDLA